MMSPTAISLSCVNSTEEPVVRSGVGRPIRAGGNVAVKETWPLEGDSEHAARCHERWSKRMNRDVDSHDYRDEWYQQQFLFCRYFISLAGCLAEDYGACSNPRSQLDGTVRFEHDGCDAFERASDGVPPQEE